MEKVKGYKVFDPNFSCRQFNYAENTEFEFKGKISMCNSGFHFCEKASDCFLYYNFNPQNIVCEVESRGEIIRNDDDSKIVTNILFVGRRLTWDEVLKVVNEGTNNTGYANSGDRNSGDRNSGNWNSGNSNSGHWNSGHRNSGNWNSGDWNSGNSNSGHWNSGNWNSGDRNSGNSNSGYRNSGAFCVDNNPVVWLFDKPTKIKVRDWENSEAVKIMSRLLETTKWIWSNEMDDVEKEAHPEYETTGGYLKEKTLHEAWGDMWNNLSEDKKKIFLTLPNFDAKKFEIITGIKDKSTKTRKVKK